MKRARLLIVATSCLAGAWPLGAWALERPTYFGPALKPNAQVRRVVTLAPSLTDIVLDLGAGERLVAVSRFDEAPQVAKLPRVGGFNDPSVEAILKLQPDLVLVQPGPGNRDAALLLARLGVSVLALPLDDFADVGRAFKEVGRALQREEAATRALERIEAVRRQVRSRAKDRPRLRVLLVFGYEPLVVAGPGSFAHELLTDTGALNAADRARTPFTPYPVESVLRARPEVVIDAVDIAGARERLKASLKLEGARWHVLSTKNLLYPGPRLADALLELEAAVYPDTVKGPPPNGQSTEPVSDKRDNDE